MNPDFREILQASAEDRRDLFLSAARRMGTPPENIEKDFWVCWILDLMFNGLAAGGPRLLFKGGTSLSKAYGLISRFSEDIDITVFRADLGQPGSVAELEKLSGKKRQARLDAIKSSCRDYIHGPLRKELARIIGATLEDARLTADQEDPDGQSLLFWYPTASAAESYIRPFVKIECGAKSAVDPHRMVTILPYVAGDLPNLSLDVRNVTTVHAERTFWDKVLIVHGLRSWFEKRGVLRHQGQRVSRHYYDLHALMHAPIGKAAPMDGELAADCAAHARIFFNSPDLALASARPGSYALMPSEGMLDGLRRDYRRMSGMIVGPIPAFDEVMVSIQQLEETVNAGSHV